SADTKSFERFHDTPHAGAVAIVAQRVVQHVRIGTRPDRAALTIRRIQFVELDVRTHPKCDARAIRPTDPWPIDQREIVVTGRVAHCWLAQNVLRCLSPLTCNVSDVSL